MTSRHVALAGTVLVVLVIIGTCGYSCGQRSRSREVASLSQSLAESQQTIRVADGLYQSRVVEVEDARALLKLREAENGDLLRALDEAKSRVLVTERVVVKWLPKSAEVTATQTEVPSSGESAGQVRKRVDFRHDFGPFLVVGHTLTDPPVGFVTVSQGRPLVLTMAVSRAPDGRWLSHVSSSDPDVGVEVGLAGVDVGLLRPRWFQRLWATGAAGLLGEPSVGLGIEYRGERLSWGPQCHVQSAGHSCGIGIGVRLFR